MKFHDNYSSISDRLKEYYKLQISSNTVKSVIETFLVANSQDAEEKTLERIKESGGIYLMLDGQRPNNGESSLWVFTDTITNRIVHMEYLSKASWDILVPILKQIEEKYGVPIDAVISDKQANIVKAVREGLPGVPHQFCHFHFIKNLHRPIKTLDSHLHQELSSLINHLYICNIPAHVSTFIHNKTKQDIREWVKPIVDDLHYFTRNRSRDFDIFAGYNSYQNLEFYLKMLDILIESTRKIRRLHSILQKTKNYLKEALKRYKPLYNRIKTLIPLFNDIRSILAGDGDEKGELKKKAEVWKLKIISLYEKISGSKLSQDIKYKSLLINSTLEEVLMEWVRLYNSHKSGIFKFKRVKNLPRSIFALEQLFSVESQHFRAVSGKSQVGNLIRTKGGEFCLVLRNYEPDKIKRTLINCDLETIRIGIKHFRMRPRKQSESWYYKNNNDLNVLQLYQKIQNLLASR
ncbi:MAG: hypothetical protein GF329_18990 [Candidatus Lokiarchaeota archaeon]|nr:hypothetical protein [Candidatus Lokiarchaeota archaeon]